MLSSRHPRLVWFVAVAAVFASLAAAPAANAVVTGTITSAAGPLQSITISPTLNCSVVHPDGGNQFYGGTACGTLLVVGGVLYGPAYIPAGSGASPRTAWTAVSQAATTGTGTLANPYTIVTTVAAGTTGIQVVETDTYVDGQSSYRTTLKISSTSALATDVLLYRAADCYLGGSDVGYGFVSPSAGAVACSRTANNVPANRVEQWIPLTSGSHYYEADYSTVWSRIGQKLPFNDTCLCATFTDNGAGLSWNRSVPAAGSVTLSHLTNFGVGARNSTLTARAAIVHLTSADDVSALQLSARLTDTATGDPVAGATIEFRAADAAVCSATTDAQGVASCLDPTALLATVQAGTYTAVFSGDNVHLASTASAGLVRVLDQNPL